MKPATVIVALEAGTATAEQVDWANRRTRVLRENIQVFGELTADEQWQLDSLLRALAEFPSRAGSCAASPKEVP